MCARPWQSRPANRGRSRPGRCSSSLVACGGELRLAARAAAPTCRKIEIDPMITHSMPLADINTAFDVMHQGKSIRSVVVY